MLVTGTGQVFSRRCWCLRVILWPFWSVRVCCW